MNSEINAIYVLSKAVAILFVVTSAVSCGSHDRDKIPIPDSINVIGDPHRLVDSDCLVDVYKLERKFVDNIKQHGLRGALDSVGSHTPVIPAPTYEGDYPPRSLEYDDYWYRTPIEAATFRPTSFRYQLVAQLSHCLRQGRELEGIPLFSVEYKDAFASFRSNDEFLYVVIPSEEIFLAAKLVR